MRPATLPAALPSYQTSPYRDHRLRISVVPAALWALFYAQLLTWLRWPFMVVYRTYYVTLSPSVVKLSMRLEIEEIGFEFQYVSNRR